jgi:hypothetical protein
MTPFPTRYCLATQKEIQDWGKRNKIEIPPLPKEFAGGTYGSGAYIFVVLPDKKIKDSWAAIDTIIHESVHVYQKSMNYIEEQSTGDEADAYHIALISTNLLKDYKKREGL